MTAADHCNRARSLPRRQVHGNGKRRRNEQHGAYDQPTDQRLNQRARSLTCGKHKACNSWALSGKEALQRLGEPLSSEAERLERLNGALGAHRSLRLIARHPARYTVILRRPDPAFDGISILDVMLQEGVPGIARVRAHMLAQITR